VPTVRTADAGETLLQVTAVQVLVDRLADDRPEESVALFVAFGVDLLEAPVVLLDEAIERCLAWAARAVDSLGAFDHAERRMQDVGRSTKRLLFPWISALRQPCFPRRLCPQGTSAWIIAAPPTSLRGRSHGSGCKARESRGVRLAGARRIEAGRSATPQTGPFQRPLTRGAYGSAGRRD